MDVVDGKIVSAVENKRGSWSGAKRSSDSVVVEELESSLIACPQLGTNSGEKIPFLVEQITKIATNPSSPLRDLSDDFLVDMQEWLAQINYRSNEALGSPLLATPSCGDGLAVRSVGKALPSDAHTRELDGYVAAPLPPVVKRQKSDSIRDGWIPGEPISPSRKGTDETALALVKTEQRWENFAQQMNGLYVESFSPLRKKMGPVPSLHRPELLTSCKGSSPVSPSSLPILAAKSTSSGVPAVAYGAMRLRTTTSEPSILPHTIQSSVFDARCSVIGSCVPDISRGIDYGSAVGTSSCAMKSSGFGAADAVVSVKSLMGQENLRESSSVCSTRTDPMYSDSVRQLHQVSRNMHSGGPPPPLVCRVDGAKGLSPPAESGPIKLDTPALSWASYSQTANSVFSTKTTQCRSWTEPLRFLLRKELTLTDVGELGRIILPKKDAESKLPQLDAKEGQFLQMEDYNSNRHWSLRFKWWPNNKSRMYVLESTGEFIKFYELKEKDVLTLYKDAEEKLVIRGQKSTPSFLRNDSISDPVIPNCSKYNGRRSIKGVSSHGAATTSTITIATPSSALPRRWGRRGSSTGPVSSLVSEAKEDTLKVKLENKGNSSSSGEGSIVKDTGSPPNSGYGSRSGKDKFLPGPNSIKPTNPTHLDTKPLNYDLTLVPGVQVGQSAFAEVGNDLEVVDADNPSLGYSLQPDTGFDWGKLPDAPALELPGFKIEESWGDSMQILRCLNISSSGAFVQN